jgi:beta-glucanase (GH16 family)
MRIFLISICFLNWFLAYTQKSNKFVPGKIWPDSKGVPINAHGGGILIHKNTYYWFGEHKTEGEAGNLSNVGVHVYSSKNLYDWKDEGIALAMQDDTSSLLVKGSVVERPKVIYNKKTKTFVMWFHHELKGQGYKAALTGLAISKNVTGPYKYIKSVNPNANTWPINFPKELQKVDQEPKMEGVGLHTQEGQKIVREGFFVRRDFKKGQMARDMTLFVDDDGRAYHIHSSENNQTLHIAELTEDYQAFTGKYARILEGKANEAPAIFKKDGKYYLISSGTTGWNPNPARLAVAENIFGPWRELGDPSRGEEKQMKTTFWSQSTFIIPVIGRKDAFIFMGDRWTPENAIDGRYIWLPIHFEEGKPILRWHENWDLSVFNAQKQTNFSPGKIWLDNNRVPINAHGGGVIFFKGTYYWYGEHKLDGKSESQFADGGIHCYASKDLMNWKDEGIVLSVDFKDNKNDLAYGCILERPKVIYNEKNKQFVAYFKLYLKGVGYETSYVGVAVSNKPNGPFTYHHKFQGGGSLNGSGDFSMFKDDDGSLYHLTVRKPDKAFVIGKLDSDYYYPEGNYQICKGIQLHTEAPVVIKRKGIYHMLGSGSSGWKPNMARYYTTENILGVWEYHGNPCVGYNSIDSIGLEKTYGGQSSYIIQVQGITDAYIAMFDIWKPENPISGRYIWLPIEFKEDKFLIAWRDKWGMNVFGNSEKKSTKNKFVDPQSPMDTYPKILSDSISQNSAMPNWRLVFSDEFNKDGVLDSSKWNYENGFVRNREAQWYQKENAICENGNLVITGKKDNKPNPNYTIGSKNWKTNRPFIEYTSASVVMQKMHSFKFGILEVRAKLDAQAGLWPAIWTLGITGEWPSNGEVDIMEYYDNRILANFAHADTAIFKAIWDGASKKIDSLGGTDWTNRFHIWTFEWDDKKMSILLDGILLNEIDLNTTFNKSDGENPFRQPHYLLLNLAMGGNKGGSLDQTQLPSKYYIDYVRLYQK